MATEYAWKIETLETAVFDSDAEKADVVRNIHWRINAADGGFSATAYGCVAADEVGEDFIPFEQLSPEDVVGWVIPKLEVTEDELKALLDQQIANEKNPPIVNKTPAAWSA
jgi:hypothetical protein|tara:strand:- start:1865 stop:2197 length:333 start_codon:yes stop_codon:yes gene_type:complete